MQETPCRGDFMEQLIIIHWSVNSAFMVVQLSSNKY